MFWQDACLCRNKSEVHTTKIIIEILTPCGFHKSLSQSVSFPLSSHDFLSTQKKMYGLWTMVRPPHSLHPCMSTWFMDGTYVTGSVVNIQHFAWCSIVILTFLHSSATHSMSGRMNVNKHKNCEMNVVWQDVFTSFFF